MEIHIDDDFDLDRIHRSGQCFRWQRLPDGTFRIPAGDRCLYIGSRGDGDYILDCSEAEFDAFWKAYFDLDEDYAAIRARIDPDTDPFLAQAAESGRGIRILRQDPWETLVSFIISQNRNIPAIRRSVELLCAAAGQERRDSRGETYHAFPSPEKILRLGGRGLAECRLGYRDSYVLAAAQAAVGGALSFGKMAALDDEAVIGELTKLYGVGVKVASCAALFGLHRVNVFPVDTWMKKALKNEYPNGYPVEKYRPYNGVFQQYIFFRYRRPDRREVF